MDIRFLQTAMELYKYLIDCLLHVRSGKRPVVFSFHVLQFTEPG